MSIKVGLIGAGAITRPHVDAFVRNPHVVKDVTVADPSQQAREALQQEFGIIRKTCAGYRELLDDPQINLIDICTPHYLHAPQAIEAMQAGKDVILEKPMALSVEQCDEMVRVSEETGRRLFCALCQRTLPAHVKAMEMIQQGAIGKVFLGTITVIGNEFSRMNDPLSWKGDWEQAGGGALFDTGYHAVYTLQQFFGPAKAVTAMTRRLIVEPENKADDTSVVVLEMEGKVVCSIVVTYSATGDRWSEERRLVGTEGSLLVRDDPEDEMPLLLLQGADFQQVKVHNPPRVQHYAIRETVSGFIDNIVEGTASDITLEEAKAAVATVMACYQSEREGRRVEVG